MDSSAACSICLNILTRHILMNTIRYMRYSSLDIHHNECSNETVEPQDFGKDKKQHHSDEKLGLLGGSSHTRIADNSDCNSGRESRQTHRDACTEIDKVYHHVFNFGDFVGNQNSDHETVDSDDTGHDHGYDRTHYHLGF